MADVAPVVHSLKGDFRHGLIRTGQSFLKRAGGNGYAEHAPAGGEQLAAHSRRTCMKNFDARNPGRGAKTGDGEAGLVASRITAGTGDDTG